MPDNEAPIKDPHVTFAQAVVALAREHGVDHLDVKFRRGSFGFFRRNPNDPLEHDYTTVSFQWHEGRHGVAGSISMRAEAQMSVKEENQPSNRMEIP